MRRDAGLKEYQEVDKDIEDKINNAEIDPDIKAQIQQDYIQIVVSEEIASAKKWSKIKTNLLQTPDRVNTGQKVQIFSERGKLYCQKRGEHQTRRDGKQVHSFYRDFNQKQDMYANAQNQAYPHFNDFK